MMNSILTVLQVDCYNSFSLRSCVLLRPTDLIALLLPRNLAFSLLTRSSSTTTSCYKSMHSIGNGVERVESVSTMMHARVMTVLCYVERYAGRVCTG